MMYDPSRSQTQSLVQRMATGITPVRLDLGLALLLFLFAFACYANTLSADFLPLWDDGDYVTENLLIRDMSPSGLWQMWSQYYFLHYIPVTLMSYALDYQLWGLNPLGYHLTNVLLHAVNAVLVYFLCCQLQPHRLVAVLAAALFVVHPLQVESVAWVSERKNVLSLLFFLAAMLTHIRLRRHAHSRWMQGATWGFYILAVLAKPIVVCGPLLLMAYDYYWAGYSRWRAIRSSLPLLALSGFSVLMSVLAHKDGGGSQHYWQDSPWLTAQLMLRICWEYVVSIVAPVDLNIRYDYVLEDVVNGRLQMGLGLGVLAILGWFAWRQPLDRPLSRFGILWIVAFMLPVANIIPFAIQRADRYFYFPSIMLFLLFSLGVYRLGQWLASRQTRQLLVVGVLLVFLPLTYLTVQRNQVWANAGAVWRDHLEDYPDSLSGLIKLATYYYEQKDYEQSEATLRSMLQYEPKYARTYWYLARIAVHTNRYEEAIPWYHKAIQLRPGKPLYHNNLGHAYAKLKHYQEAIEHYQETLALDPTYTRARVNLAKAALHLENYSLARDTLVYLLKKYPKHHWVVSSLCLTLVALDDLPDAVQQCQEAVRIKPQHGPSLHALSRVYLKQGQPKKALSWGKKAVAAAPKWGPGYQTLGDIYTVLGQTTEATSSYKLAEVMQAQNR